MGPGPHDSTGDRRPPSRSSRIERRHPPVRGCRGTVRGPRPWVASASSALQEAAELFRPRRMPKLPEGLGLDLADALARDGEVLTDLLERVLTAVREPEPESQHLFLPGCEGVEDAVGLFAKAEADDRLDRRDHLLVLNEVAQVAVLLLADRCLEGDRLLGNLQALPDFVDRHVHLGRDLL